QAITLTLEDEIDCSRGDMIVRTGEAAPQVSAAFDAHIVWMNEVPLQVGKEYAFKLAGKNVFGRVEHILHRVDVNTMEQFAADELKLNEFGLCRVVVNAPVVFDAYRQCRGSGSLIVIDRLSNATAGAGMITGAAQSDSSVQDANELARLRAFELEFNALVRKHFPHWEAKDISQLLK
ncbi:MAG TPA: sulfate adenylyltransferase subunit CysN, partial [Pseudogulbenkiania sp.]|nr:sulfate adenylyltransferase subunit CysN [Pseudogulbenkiania sp.]